jgi:hypothetical protein
MFAGETVKPASLRDSYAAGLNEANLGSVVEYPSIGLWLLG